MSDKTIPVYPDKCSDAVWQPRRKTHAVKIQNGPVTVTVGGGAPVVVQSMTNTATENVADTVEQVKALARAGSELVRLTVNTPQAAMAVPEIRAQLDAEGFYVPLVGDFHYNGHKLLTDYPAYSEIAQIVDGPIRLVPQRFPSTVSILATWARVPSTMTTLQR